MSLYCQKCGADARPAYKFCPICGGKQFGSSQPSSQITAQQAAVAAPVAATVFAPTAAPVSAPAPAYASPSTANTGVAGIDVSNMSYASGGRRLLAALIDFAITVGPLILITVIFGDSSSPLGAVMTIGWAVAAIWYYCATESGEHQATYGKRAMGLVVAGMDGGRITGSRALGRNLLKGISTNIILPFIVFFFTERRQALHDLWGGTVVMYRGQ
jgi:uncharacterized RDD family membrane protein YckC